VVLAATGRGGRPTLPRRTDLDDHPRVRHARSLRSDVRVHGDDRGFVTLGIGLGGLTELSVEVAPGRHGTVRGPGRGLGNGLGRGLLADALALVDADHPVIAEAAPGNARSLRALLAAGFVPIGSAVHITHAAHPPTVGASARGT
jgi:hypothetical protein